MPTAREQQDAQIATAIVAATGETPERAAVICAGLTKDERLQLIGKLQIESVVCHIAAAVRSRWPRAERRDPPQPATVTDADVIPDPPPEAEPSTVVGSAPPDPVDDATDEPPKAKRKRKA